MSARIPPGYAEVVMTFSLAGDPEPMLTAIGVALASGVSGDQTVTDAILAAMQDNIKELCTSEYTVGPGWVTYGQDGPDDIRIDGTIAADLGTVGTAACPNNTAWLVKKNTASPGRRGRGRMFVPGITEGNVTATGEISGTAVTNAQVDINAMRTAMVALSSVDALVLFRGPDSETGLPALTPAVITGLTVAPKVATQRRRMRR